MIAGTAYGVVLNDRAERAGLAVAFGEKPYGAPPVAPVVYIKPRTCFAFGGAPVPLPADLAEVNAAATIALLFGASGPVAAALALDVFEPHDSYYRPAIRQRCRDGFLPVGAFAGCAALTGEIVTRVDGEIVHGWSLDRLVRDVPTLIADLSAFMTIGDGDVLLVGLAADAPRVKAMQRIEVRHPSLPALRTRIEPEPAA